MLARLPLILLLAGCATPFFSLLPWGVWQHTDPVAAAFWFISAGVGLCLLIRSAQGQAISLPLALWPLGALILWSLIAAPFTPYPLRLWIGTAETAGGTATLLAIGLMILGALHAPKHSTLLYRMATATALALTAFHLTGDADFAPYNYTDYLGLIGICLTIIGIARLPSPGLRDIALAFAIGGTIVALSHNLTAQLALIGAAIAGGLFFLLRHWLEKRWMRCLLPTAIALIPLLVLAAEWVLPLNCTPTATTVAYDQPLCSRMLLARLGVRILMENPLLLLTGAGWGSTSDLIARYLWLLPEIHLYHQGVWAPNWSIAQGDAFHIHHSVLDATLAAGLPAGICLLVLPALLTYYATPLHRPWLAALWGGMALVHSFWFTLPMVWPFYALALAVTAASSPPLRTLPASLLSGTISIGSLALAMGAAWQLHIMTRSMELVIRYAHPSEHTLSTALALGDSVQGDRILYWFAKEVTVENRHYDQHNLTPRSHHHLWTDILITLVTAKPRSPRLDAQGAEMLNQLCFYLKQPEWAPLKEKWCGLWPEYILTLHRQMPLRSDMLISTIQYLTRKGDIHSLWRFTLEILAQHTNDPVGRWSEGMLMLQEGKKEDALPLLRQALDAGVDRFLPVTATFATGIRQGLAQ